MIEQLDFDDLDVNWMQDEMVSIEDLKLPYEELILPYEDLDLHEDLQGG